ncbi:hypothetical protein PoB_004208600 [Plakobranchus ocellatus]|uniref:Apple domain-containing protein n=1 Tax=Plakobranchus ocellatus TaxID=259542 RepID=A0AAV4AWU6_9GAST|nr:hypothetical protein PoB_004208600 [Plakobranchus ocellatus]
MRFLPPKVLTSVHSASSLTSAMAILLLISLSLSPGQVDAQIQSLFKLLPGYRLDKPTTSLQTFVHEDLSLIQCGILCGDDCGMFTYSKVHSRCSTYKHRNFEIGYTTARDSDWTLGYKRLHELDDDKLLENNEAEEYEVEYVAHLNFKSSGVGASLPLTWGGSKNLATPGSWQTM